MNDLDLIERICPSSKCNCGHPSYRCDECKGIVSDYLYDHDAKVRAEFAEKIRAHMTKYCHARLEQQYCAMEVIDFIGKLLGEKDFSIDVEEEIKKHDAKVRTDAINELVRLIEDTYGYDYASDIKPLAEELSN